ncbi:hypothetical protein [Granulicella sibirica]|uniref:Uncharacterized protein n=1 Tax=Granulicella sibirica TaxID=2479048 RepID=A0A4Q0T250_9BACT|nr:hypothetical protein [Granulicella sibirica]RXH57673.1 hypothetical protein GRAN_0983 [Granulicella sibirica]
MAEDFTTTTMICMFHSAESAQAAVVDLLALGLSESEIAVVGDARTELTGSTPTSTLQAMRVPEGDISMLIDGLRDGGTVVAVMAPEVLADRIEDIFQDQSAAKVTERVIETNAAYPEVTGQFVNPEKLHLDTTGHNRLDIESGTEEEAEEEPIDAIDPLNRVD